MDDNAASIAKYRNSLLWAIDYFSVDTLTRKNRTDGVKKLADALRGAVNDTAIYEPNEWDDSYGLFRELQAEKPSLGVKNIPSQASEIADRLRVLADRLECGKGKTVEISYADIREGAQIIADLRRENGDLRDELCREVAAISSLVDTAPSIPLGDREWKKGYKQACSDIIGAIYSIWNKRGDKLSALSLSSQHQHTGDQK